MKSTAILFGRSDKLIIGLMQLAILLLMALVGTLLHLNGACYWTLLLAAALFVYQQKPIAGRECQRCFQAFLNNNYFGMMLFLRALMNTPPFSQFF